MADASNLQTSFLGGEWSTFAQGRADKEQYRTALNLCYNAVPLEEGAWTRRAATMFAATTRSGARGLLREFAFNQAQPITLEFTAGHMRMFAGLGLVLEKPRPVGSISAANPAVVVTQIPHPYATGDQVQFSLTRSVAGTTGGSGVAPLFNRQFAITVTDTTHFSLADPVTGASIDGSVLDLAGWSATVARVVDFSTPYTLAEVAANGIRVIQNMDVALTCDGSNVPRILSNQAGSTFLPLPGTAENDACFPLFNFGSSVFIDGPYLDPPTDGSTLTATGTGSPVTLNASSVASINGGQGFLATDVGRAVRLFSEPPTWAKATAYAVGANVKYQGAYWQALLASTGKQPDVSQAAWAVTTGAAAWTWGTISAVNSTSQVVVALAAADPLGTYAGGTMLNGVQPVVTWQLGVYSNTTGWPTGGAYHEGRFWLFGAQFNRADATMDGNAGTPWSTSLRFNPTALDGTVADDNGIPVVLDAEQVNTIFWMVSEEGGITMGTQGGEFLIRASDMNDPITPANVQAKRVTRFGCANVEPRRTPLTLVFAERYNRKLIEYLEDAFSRRILGFNLAIDAGHLTGAGIEEIAYVQERTPIIWMRMGDGTLKGCSYKRESPFGTQPASFYGWHQATLGSGRLIESIQAGPSPGGATDALTLISNDPATNVRWVEMMAPLMGETDALTQANFVDAAIVPTFGEVSGNNVIFYGLNQLAGKTLTAWFGGVDAGDIAVSATGTLTVPINVAGGILTTSYLQTLTASDYGYLDVVLNVTGQGGGWYSPVGAGLDYTASSSAPLHYSQMSNVVFFDWDKGLLWNQQAQAGGDPGTNGHSLFCFNLATRAQLHGPLDPGDLAFATATCIGYDGNLYYGTITSSYLVGRYNAATLTKDDVLYSDTHSLPSVGYVAPLEVAGNQYVVAISLNSGQGGGGSSSAFVIQMTGSGSPAAVPFTTNVYTTSFDEGNGSIAPANVFPCRGRLGSAVGCYDWGSAYAVALGTLGPGYSGNPQLGVYEISADTTGFAGKSKIGVVTPAQVHGGWTTFAVEGWPVLDETDGHLLVLFTNAGTYVLAKISTANAAVLWTLTLNSSVDFHTSRVRGGALSWVDGTGSPWTLKEINTLTGAVAGTLSESVFGPGAFSSDDKSGMWVLNINDIGTQCWGTFGPNAGGGSLTPAVTYKAPAALGFNYASRGQTLRALDPQAAGAQNGPALGKTRRTHQAAFLLSQTGVGSFYHGTDFTTTTQHKATFFTYPGGSVALSLTALFSGVLWVPIEDPYSFDGMVTWEVKRPYPCTVTALEGFLHTQDR